MIRTPRITLLVGGVALASLAAAGCNDQGFTRRIDGTIAVVIGDFDNIQETFNRQEIDTVRYDGIISTATWVEDPDDFAPPQLSVEGLFTSERNQELINHGAVFLSSGSRGFGDHIYTGLAPDDQIISDAVAVENALAYVRGGGTLVVTDWSYDLVNRAFPGSIDFLGDEAVLDDAQRGDIGRVQGYVVDEELRQKLELDEAGNLAVDFNFSNWAVMEGIDTSDDRVKVWIEGTITYRDASGEGTQTIERAPLLVTIDTGGEFQGRLVFSSFHLDAQNPAVVDPMLELLVGELGVSQVITDPGVQE